MNKIIPIICIIVAALGAVIATMGIITVCIALQVPSVALVAVPAAIAGGLLSGASTAITAILFRDKLCKIAFFINAVALIVSIVSVTIWIVAL